MLKRQRDLVNSMFRKSITRASTVNFCLHTPGAPSQKAAGSLHVR